MDTIIVAFIGAFIGFLSGKLHTHITSSSCMYGLCYINGLDMDLEQTNKNPINNIENKI